MYVLTCVCMNVYLCHYHRQPGRSAIRSQTRASVASEISNPSNNFPLPSTIQISVGDAGYSRQVDTDPVGIDIGEFSIHTVSGMHNIYTDSAAYTDSRNALPL